MARGWESKSVEAQQEAASVARPAGPKLAPADAAREASRKSARATLLLARTRALADLQTACVPAHRAMLEQAIAELDQRLAALDQ